MLISILLSTRLWNFLTYYLAVPNSTSQCVTGRLLAWQLRMLFSNRATSPAASTGIRSLPFSRRSQFPRRLASWSLEVFIGSYA